MYFIFWCISVCFAYFIGHQKGANVGCEPMGYDWKDQQAQRQWDNYAQHLEQRIRKEYEDGK